MGPALSLPAFCPIDITPVAFPNFVGVPTEDPSPIKTAFLPVPELVFVPITTLLALAIAPSPIPIEVADLDFAFFPTAIPPALLFAPRPTDTLASFPLIESFPIAIPFSLTALTPNAIEASSLAWASDPIANACLPVAFVLTPNAIEASPLAWVFLVKFPAPSFVADDE